MAIYLNGEYLFELEVADFLTPLPTFDISIMPDLSGLDGSI
jgi:hypothetical protein